MNLQGANLQSLQALVEFRNSLPILSKASVNEVQEMILSTQRSVQEAQLTLSECRTNLWEAENILQNTEEPGYAEYSAVEEARTEVAQAEAYFSEVQAAYTSFQSIARALSNRLTVHFANAQNFLDERIEAAKFYQSLSVSDFAGTSAINNPTQARHSNTAVPTQPLRNNSDVLASPLRGASVSALPVLPNGMEWVEIDKINRDGIDGVPDNLEFRKVPKENMKEMLETFESQLLPILDENKDVSTNELLTLDKQNAAEDSSRSLRLCHESMIGSSKVSDVIVLHSKPASTVHTNHPAANTPAFESGRKACIEGRDRDSNPYRNLVGREGAANIWDQGWQLESDNTELGFTSGRHRTLVAQELGWKFIPARVLMEK